MKFLKRIAENILNSPIGSTLRSRSRGMATILCYHRILTEIYDESFPESGVSIHVDEFEKQMIFLRDNFHCVSLDELITALESGKSTKHMVAVTFDDGSKDNLTLGFPILERLNIPACFFLISGLFFEKRLWRVELGHIIRHSTNINFNFDTASYSFNLHSEKDRLLATKKIRSICEKSDEVKIFELIDFLHTQSPVKYKNEDFFLSIKDIQDILKSSLITFGAHSVSHPILKDLPEESVRNEMIQSRVALQKITGKDIIYFAYPYGTKKAASLREFSIAKEIGFKASFTTRVGHIMFEHRNYLEALPRISIGYFDTGESFLWKIAGAYSLLTQRGVRVVTD